MPSWNSQKAKGMVGIKGHRSVGDSGPSTYNALPIESVQALIDCMHEFEKNKRVSLFTTINKEKV